LELLVWCYDAADPYYSSKNTIMARDPLITGNTPDVPDNTQRDDAYKKLKEPLGHQNLQKLFDVFIGQDEIKQVLLPKIIEAIEHKRVLPHMLFVGLPESGKATLATLIAKSIGVSFQMGNALFLKKLTDLLPYVTRAKEGSIILIEDIDSLTDSMCGYLLHVLENFQFGIPIGEGMNARTVNMNLNKFTLVGTSCKPSRINSKLTPWMTVYDFKYYSEDQFSKIVAKMAIEAGLNLSTEGLALFVECCHESLETASVLMKKISGHLGADKSKRLTPEVLKPILSWLGHEPDRQTSITIAERLSAMSGTEFEQFVAKIFHKKGFHVELTATTGDHGIDLIVRKNNRQGVVQCKRWTDSVGEPVVRDFYGTLLNSGSKSGFIFTTAYFTSQAIAFVENKPIKLVDMDSLVKMVNDLEAS